MEEGFAISVTDILCVVWFAMFILAVYLIQESLKHHHSVTLWICLCCCVKKN